MSAPLFLVGNGAGFSGDRIDAPIPVVRTLVRRGLPAALFFEVLGERTVALAQLERRRDPDAGFEPMLERLIEPILKPCAENLIKIIGNFGGANPAAAARCIARIAVRQGLPDLKIGVVEGDDVRSALDLAALQPFEADATIDVEGRALVAANAYLDAQPIVDALRQGADVVVTGRTGDPSLALAPLIHHFGWSAEDWQRLAAGATAGHLLECGSQICGGVFFDPGYKDIPDPADIGFPIAEVDEEGGLVLTKAEDTGGLVDLRTVKEQLLYEVHDPACYVTPDVTIDMTGISLEQEGPDRVRINGVRGLKRPEQIKVTACFEGGWLGEGEVSVAGPNCVARARAIADVLKERIRRRGLEVRSRVDIIGLASVHDSDDGALWRAHDGPEPRDLRIRLAAAGDSRDDADQAAREVLALLCCGPAGTGGARWRTTQRISTRSYLVPRASIRPSATCHTSGELAQ
ncbi:acyclic terpene utilization AtuA family protein [Geminicoccaceae bacterium 1502E]|nr:acyclic terpene utilization AtuA family protein [Geminicoccaceae bacterium 1502E]